MSLLVFKQSARWSKLIDGGTDVYDEERCAYCARPVRPDAARFRTARTNDGEWWLVSVDENLGGAEWKDFQTQLDGSRAPTFLPIGPDCLLDHSEFSFAVVSLACTYGAHVGPTRVRHDRLHGVPMEAWICERCGKDIQDQRATRRTFRGRRPSGTICSSAWRASLSRRFRGGGRARVARGALDYGAWAEK